MAVLIDNTLTSSLETSERRNIVKTSAGKLVLFAYTEGYISYKTSSDNGVTWDSSWINISSAPTVTNFDVCIDGSNNIYIGILKSSHLYFVLGTYSAGTWSWGSLVTVDSNTVYWGISIALRSNGDIWISGKELTIAVAYYSTDGGSLWTRTTVGSSNYSQIRLIPYGSNIMLITTISAANGGLKSHIYTSSWSGATIISTLTYGGSNDLGVSYIDTSHVYAAIRTSSGIKIYFYNGSSWDSGTIVGGSTSSDYSPAMTNVGGTPILVWRAYDSGSGLYKISYKSYSGGSWGAQQDLTILDNYNNCRSIDYDSTFLYIDDILGFSSPYSLYFDKVSFAPPTQQTILSDVTYKAVGTQHTILADTYFKGENQHLITSDVTFIATQKTILSDVSYFGTVQHTILSDAKYVISSISNLNNKFNFAHQTISNILNKFNTVKQIVTTLNNFINTCKGIFSNINNDFRLSASGLKDISNDVRFLKSYQLPGPVGFQSLGKTYIHVYFNSIEQTDVDIDSTGIHKMVDGSHTLSLDLARPYDTSVPALETVVTVYYNTYLLYKGYITEINPAESPEKINIICNDRYWLDNRTDVYYLVGHTPLEYVPTDETYYETIQQAILTQHGLNVNIGNFVPQTINNFGIGKSEALTTLINSSGNFSWYFDESDNFKLWRAGQGTVINIERQTLGQNIGLFQLVNHQFKKDATNIINKYRVQMGTIANGNSANFTATNYHSYFQFATPDWDETYERLAKDSISGEGWDYHPGENSHLYEDVFRVWHLPFLSSDLSTWDNERPPQVVVYSPNPWQGGGFSEFQDTETVLTDGFTIDYQNQKLIFNEPMYFAEYNNGELISVRAPTIRLFLYQKNKVQWTLDINLNPLEFYTAKVGTYPTTIQKDLFLSDLNKLLGDTPLYKFYWKPYYIPPWDDTNFANDIALWQLSKTKEIHITGTIELTLDTVCFYGIDLTKRIFINGITDTPMNIISMDYNMNNFTVTLQLENSQPYQRTISFPWHGD